MGVSIERGELLREGKARQVSASRSPDHVWIHSMDDATAFNGIKKATIRDKDVFRKELGDTYRGLFGRVFEHDLSEG